MMKTAVLYARYSSDKQREASIDDQLRTCRDYCKREGITVVKEYADHALSGKTDHRPQFREMVNNAPESDYVVVYTSDRFSRDRYDAIAYKRALLDAGVRVLSATEHFDDTPEGFLQEGMMEVLSEYYVRNLARSVRRGMEGNALNAKDNGYRIFGYVTDPETRKYVIQPEEAACVREMFGMRVEGTPVNAIAREMRLRGWTTSTGKPVDYNWAHRILHRKAYTGLYSWGGIEVEGGMPRIVDDGIFELAQKVVSMRRGRNGHQDSYRLTGKIFCGYCGKPMHGTAGTGKNGRRYNYYACKEKGGCGRPYVPRSLVEDSIAAKTIEICSDEERMRLFARRVLCLFAESDEGQDEMEAVERSITDLELEQRKLESAAMKGFITDGMIARNEEIKSQLESLRSRYAELAEMEVEVTEDDIIEYMMHGFDRSDEDFIFGALVREVYLYEDRAVLAFNFRDEAGQITEERVQLVRAALEEKERRETDEGFASCSSGVPRDNLGEIILLPGGFGIIIELRRAA